MTQNLDFDLARLGGRSLGQCDPEHPVLERGLNSVGIASAGGAGRALAEWVVEGEPTSDLVAVDVRRFADYASNPRWLRDRVVEILGLHYAVP